MGKRGAKDENRLIIDALLNIPLLYWATRVTRDVKYQQIGDRHYQTALKTVFRSDGSTFHTYFFDDDGNPLRGATRQGYSDDSDWARGQAWAIYGTALHYYDTHDKTTFDVFKAVTNFFLIVCQRITYHTGTLSFRREVIKVGIHLPRQLLCVVCMKC